MKNKSHKGLLKRIRISKTGLVRHKTSGHKHLRSGKGGKFRVLPLNVDARQAITAYQKVRPTVSTDHLFIGQRGGWCQFQSC